MVTLAQKQDRVVELKDQFSRTKLAMVSDFRGLTVKEMTTLRRRLQDAGGDYTVAKNTLVRRALKETEGMPAIDNYLEGPTALVFGFSDPVTPVKTLLDYFKETKKELEIRGGIVEGKVVSANDLKQIATLPSREEMVAKLMGSMQSPAQGVVITLSGVARNLVYALEAVRKQKEENS
ncbi:50S ribosomal protein L10 [bacterium (Candidatus Blackallbacteria) CG17_big_fil_post_rev_8_21_14_2_50_48_46]|uniref:Large ribosomal subunit protein uL10 n=1 Tax=bacterium (Candidatus Blackallbacteria) CG17_big_fil_post_rev_8_21_14_2_50_48_46 TaxID=2014261 RepID=A0A2M7G302_9BACT|nr:MAG: 50S ribosomal protein L10 [bacterium (Candidatus Blackallbacteria) CG18_big_fil_WC_8_21_14_2_50_49_26]PIW16121.1 MAG: 50S ribosomal protein L10 [bacterium (Candidatus Blackallbacteria) CG17_big_fil_post_rev_8_21_14_2_50_48_46]PIW45770.1 MAG: 50S ribosomal protein L10 [bacterium (Candidatus Blackallbacteria) CG13_big_fil_rev_8_21_14_2_50_49_14]